MVSGCQHSSCPLNSTRRLSPFGFRALALGLALTIIAALHAADSAAPARKANSDLVWPAITQTAKPWTRWWWPGSAVDKANLTAQLEAIAAAGFGGVEITPIYGAKGYEDRFIDFLSPKYMEMLEYTGREAKRLGLGVDMATGTGWPFGGPWVAEADANTKAVLKNDRIVGEPTRQMVKRAAPGDAGLVLDPYSPAAITRYLGRFDAAFTTFPRELIRSQFHDSFEYYDASWTPKFEETFRKMHGYDIQKYAAELLTPNAADVKTMDLDTLARIKGDYRATLAQLHLDYLHTWVQWSHDHGWIARNQSHGAPANLLDLYANADIPETEIFGSHEFPIPGFRRDPGDFDPAPGRTAHPSIINRFASSAAHVAGHPLASSETFTWLREHFREAPSEMKPEADALFLAGINHIFFHGNAYSPADAPWPGWVFYASTQANPRNPLWRDIGDGLNAYLARCQSLLQAGKPDNDVLIYWPIDDLWHNPDGLMNQLTVHASWLPDTPCGKLMTEFAAKGLPFDLISDAQLFQIKNEQAGRGLSGPGGHFGHIIVPKTEHMPVETLHQLLVLAEGGANIIFMDQLPTDVPGFGSLAERRARLKAELSSIKFAGSTAKVGNGTVSLIPPPYSQGHFFFSLNWAGSELGTISRQMADGKIYFFANQSAKTIGEWVNLWEGIWIKPTSAILMDARSGHISEAKLRVEEYASGASGKSVYLQLQPGESIFVRTFTDRTVKASGPSYWHDAGVPIPVASGWHVTFTAGGPVLPPAFTTRELKSWTAQGGEAERFGGTARYETEFTLPDGANADDWRLDLGDVRETARVFVNGKEVDLLWSLPFRTRIGAYLKPGRNTLALEVTSTAANRIRDLDRRKVPWKNFYEINFVDITYQPFDASNWALQPCGLLGPVTLTPLQAFDPAKQ